MGKLYFMGERQGLGSSMKMINQVLAGNNVATAAEALAFSAKLGLDTGLVFEIISRATGNSFVWGNRMPHILDDNPTPHAAVGIWLNDLPIVPEEAKPAGLSDAHGQPGSSAVCGRTLRAKTWTAVW